MAALKSTRFNIVQQALVDSLERLNELPLTPRIRELRTKALSYDRALRSWKATPPSEEQRAALTKQVIELNVEVMTVAREMRASGGEPR